jgi:hypothetical protein
MLAADLLHDAAQVGLCLFHRHTGAQARDAFETVIGARVVLDLELQRRPHLGVVGEVKAAWHDADDAGLGGAVTDRLTEYAGIRAVAAAPKVLAQNHGERRLRAVLFALEGTAQKRLDAENAEERLGAGGGGDAFRFHVAAQRGQD